LRLFGPFFSLLLFLPLATAAQEKDPHYLTPRIAPTAHHSTFIHGYLHGYEEGFHEADFDLHMGRVGNGASTHEHKVTGYRSNFGAKRMYDDGFREGFRVGYADATAGRSFRAIQTVAEVGGADGEEQARESLPYDEAVRMGYLAGQRRGLSDARGQHESNPSPECPANGTNKADFCAAYVKGYGIGYADGFVNQAKTVVADAK
jgi:hypothetical protein